MLPVLDGDFRVSLQGSPENELQLCLESGDPEVQTMEAADAVFINSGDNPFKLMKESIKLLSKIKGNFKHIEDKEIPANLDWFGWCTWDAFYKAVNPAGIEEGLKRYIVHFLFHTIVYVILEGNIDTEGHLLPHLYCYII
nr:hypothetical protein SEVIR_4G124701v2 [Setaria viridis]